MSAHGAQVARILEARDEPFQFPDKLGLVWRPYPLREAGELSAAECADFVGISRVSARRYLEHFVARGSAGVRLQYGGGGRPERRYRAGR